MRRKTLFGTLVVSLLVLGASTADAQFASPIRFNVHAGAALPVGDTGDEADLGFRVGAGLELRPMLSPVGLRFDGAFDRMPIDQDLLDFFGADDGNLTLWSITANAVLAAPASPLYFIGGIGLYSSKVTVDGADSDTETDFGFNLGAGMSLPLTGFSTFIEARYNRVSSEGGSIQYIPIVFGIRF